MKASGLFPVDWRRSGVPLLLVATTVLLVLGLTLPTLRVDRFVSSDAHSILGGIRKLLESGQVLLGLIILAFSVVFPAVKLVALTLVWAQKVDDGREKLGWLAILGKWSMLDVYVVMLFVGAVRLGVLAEFEAEAGIYVFATSILLTMTATKVVVRLGGYRDALRLRSRRRLRGPGSRALSLAALGSFVAGISLPMLEVEKWLFWSSETSLLGALGTLVEEGQLPLAALVFLFVVLLPGAHFAGILLVRWVPALPGKAVTVLLAIEEWAMLDVFALALLVVAAQVASQAAITPRIGFAFLLLAAGLSAVDAWRLRSVLKAPGSPSRAGIR